MNSVPTRGQEKAPHKYHLSFKADFLKTPFSTEPRKLCLPRGKIFSLVEFWILEILKFDDKEVKILKNFDSLYEKIYKQYVWLVAKQMSRSLSRINCITKFGFFLLLFLASQSIAVLLQ